MGTRIFMRTYANFNKNTTFKGRIESGLLSENEEVWKNYLSPQILEAMSNYIQTNKEIRRSR